MSRREDIDNSIWSDPDFAALSPQAKLLYVWTFTNQRCGMAGIYKLPAGTAAFEIGMTNDQEAEAFAELEAGRFAFYQGGVLLVRARVKHLRTRGPNMVKSILSDVEKIAPIHPLRQMFVEEYAGSWIADSLVETGGE